MQVEYNDGDTEVIVLSDERIKFHITYDELLCLNLKCGVPNFEKKGYNELLALAVSLRDYQNCEPGDLIWAKLTGTLLNLVSSGYHLLIGFLSFYVIHFILGAS